MAIAGYQAHSAGQVLHLAKSPRVVGRLRPLPEGVHVLISRCAHDFTGKRDSAAMIRFRTLGWRDYPGSGQRAQFNPTDTSKPGPGRGQGDCEDRRVVRAAGVLALKTGEGTTSQGL